MNKYKSEMMKFYVASDYQAQCNAWFIMYRADILVELPFARVEHIGASSIKGAVSKGDLDIFVGISESEIDSAIKVLRNLGFHEKRDTLRTADLCMLEHHTDDVAIQLVVNGSEFEDFLEFRDKLRASSSLLQEYNALKMSCIGLGQDDYRAKKSAFIRQVLNFCVSIISDD